jgi:transcriptional regulator with XRE-family HTH domain
MKSIFSDDYKKSVEKLKSARLRADLSQKQLADKLGVTQSYISKVEQGQTRLDIVQLKQIAKAIGVKTEDLL